MNDKGKGGDKLFPDLKKGGDEAAKPADEKKTPEQSGNVFTSLFDKEKTSESAKQDDITDAVVKKSGTKQSILGPKPKMTGVQTDAKPVSFAWTSIKLLVFAMLILWIGSFLTMGAKFNISGLNQQVKADESVEDLKTAQAEYNMDNYLVGYYYLDNFAYLADSYLYKSSLFDSDFTSASEKNTLITEMQDLETDMIDSLTNAQTSLSKSIINEEVEIEAELSSLIEYKSATTAYIQSKIDEISATSTEGDEDVDLELRGLDGAMSLLENTVYVEEVLAASTTDGLDQDVIEALAEGFSEITVDNFTIISQIKSNRQSWSDIIREISDITKSVDPLYGTSVSSDISYSSYSLAADTQTVSIQGNTTTDDSRNFTLISNLIDAFEQSSLFMDVNERTFNKTESGDESSEYESSFRLEFKLQEGEDERDATYLIFEEEEEEEAPVKVSITGESEDTEETEEDDENAVEADPEVLELEAELEGEL